MWSWWDWFRGLLRSWGLLNKEGNIVILGLDNAGKTTLLYKLKRGRVVSYVPTQRPNMEELAIEGITIRALDLGGHAQVRRLWNQYLPRMDAVIFVVDSSDRIRIDEARREFMKLLTTDDPQFNRIPIAILGNKSDIQGSMSREELRDVLGLRETELDNPNSTRPLQVFHTSVIRGFGYPEAFQWIAKHL